MLFFNFGEMTFRAYDWPKEFMYYSVMKHAFDDMSLPYHVSKAFHGTKRFLALPETLLSPQVFFLPLFKTGEFILLNTLLLYSVGFAGCLAIRKKYKLSAIPFASLFLLFNFNGHITSHLAVGHSMWNGYFLLPFYCLYLMEIIEGDVNNAAIKLSLVLFAIVLQGAFHIFMWCILLLCLLALSKRKYLMKLLSAIGLSMVLSSFRIIPAVITPMGENPPFISGYSTLRELFDGLTLIRTHTYPWLGGIFGVMKWWEYDVYIGFIGLGIILYFGIYKRLKDNNMAGEKHADLDIPILVLSLMSVGYFYAFVQYIPFSLLKVERVSTRFIIIPLLILIIISCIRMESFVRGLSSKEKAFLSLLVLQMAFSLATHSFKWSVHTVEKYFDSQVLDLSIGIVGIEDRFYTFMVDISFLISLCSALIVAYFFCPTRNLLSFLRRK